MLPRLAFAVLAVVAALGAQGTLRDETPDLRRARLTAECRNNPGWRLVELEHFFVVTDVDDRRCLDELARRVEGMRTEALALLVSPRFAARPLTPPFKATLRVFARSDLYFSAGGVAGADGIYFPERIETLLNAGLRSEGPRRLHRVAQSMVVCELIDTHVGREPQAPWFQFGVQEYFGGFELDARRWRAQPHAVLLPLVRENIETDRVVPLRELVAMDWERFLATSKYGTDVGDHWAQAWALVWYLRERKPATLIDGPRALRRYLDQWRASRDAAAASAAAFEGVDWDALEADWRRFLLAAK